MSSIYCTFAITPFGNVLYLQFVVCAHFSPEEICTCFSNIVFLVSCIISVSVWTVFSSFFFRQNRTKLFQQVASSEWLKVFRWVDRQDNWEQPKHKKHGLDYLSAMPLEDANDLLNRYFYATTHNTSREEGELYFFCVFLQLDSCGSPPPIAHSRLLSGMELHREKEPSFASIGIYYLIQRGGGAGRGAGRGCHRDHSGTHFQLCNQVTCAKRIFTRAVTNSVVHCASPYCKRSNSAD